MICLHKCKKKLRLHKKGLGGNVVSFRVETYKIYKRQDKAKVYVCPF